MPKQPRFKETFCSQCGMDLGPGDSGLSHCSDHKSIAEIAESLSGSLRHLALVEGSGMVIADPPEFYVLQKPHPDGGPRDWVRTDLGDDVLEVLGPF